MPRARSRVGPRNSHNQPPPDVDQYRARVARELNHLQVQRQRELERLERKLERERVERKLQRELDRLELGHVERKIERLEWECGPGDSVAAQRDRDSRRREAEPVKGWDKHFPAH